MEELKRIFFSRKFAGALLLLLILNAWFTWNDQRPDRQTRLFYEENYQGNYVKDENRKYIELLKKYQAMDMEQAVSEMETYWENYWKKLEESQEPGQEQEVSLSGEDVEVSAMSDINEQINYITGFGEYLQEIDESAEKMKTVSALGAEGSFSRKNIDKTVKDFQPLKTIELKLDNDRAVNAFTDGTLTGLLLMVMAVVIVLIMLEERRRGLWQFVYSLPKGRSRLAFFRCITMFLGVFSAGVLLEAENLIITGWYYGGFGDLSRAVQSNPEFSGCVLEISMGNYLLLTIIMKIIVCTFTGMIFWAAVSSLKSHAGAFAALAVIVAGEYYAYTQIGVQSSWNRFRYMNLFAFLDSGHALTSYRNLNFFGSPVGIHTLLLFALPALLLVVFLCVIFLGRQKPFAQRENLFSRIWEKIICKIKPYRHNSLFLHECYKIFIKQRCIVILAVLIVLSVLMADTEEIYYDYSTTIYNSYISQIKGAVTEEKTDYLKSESEIWLGKITESTEKTERYQQLLEQNDSTHYLEIFSSDTEYEQELKRIRQYEQARGIVEELLVLSDRLLDLQSEGINAGYVNRIGYEMYLGSGSTAQSEKEAVMMLAFLIASLAGVKSYESSQNAEKFIKSTKRGRNSLYKRKCIVGALAALLVFLPVAISGFYSVYKTYGMEGFDMSVKSLDAFADFPADLSLGGMLLLVWASRYIMLAAVALIVLFLSGKGKNMMISLFVCLLVILAPAGIVYMGFSAVSFLSVLRPMTVTYFWNQYGFDGVMWFLPCLLLLAAGVLAWRLGKGDSVKAAK